METLRIKDNILIDRASSLNIWWANLTRIHSDALLGGVYILYLGTRIGQAVLERNMGYLPGSFIAGLPLIFPREMIRVAFSENFWIFRVICWGISVWEVLSHTIALILGKDSWTYFLLLVSGDVAFLLYLYLLASYPAEPPPPRTHSLPQPA
jgi:hypothetical protein